MKIGITGSRHGITKQQLDFVKANLKAMNIQEVHHGSCIGVDEAVHNELVDGHAAIIVHPPTKPFFRFYPKPHKNIQVLNERDFLTRNRDIVDESQTLFAFPFDFKNKLRSGTWSTMKYAYSKRKKVYCIYPDGHVVDWSPNLQKVLDSKAQDSIHKQNLNDV